ncbi:MAG: hypothetical protein KA335_07605 [Ramlibacter sp.]|nr:hypothetical protein [Ramlibacter sp.]
MAATVVGATGVNTPWATVAAACLPPADTQLVQRFDDAMGKAPFELATDDEIRRLSAVDADRLRARHGSDDEAFRRDARIFVDIQRKIIEDSILRGVRQAFEMDLSD